MKKRHCRRFSIPGTTLFYKKKPPIWRKGEYTDDFFPVLDISRGGLKFLSNDRMSPGAELTIKLVFPHSGDEQPEIKAIVRWISRNREESYRYQTGVSFNAYGPGKKENPEEILSLLKSLESSHMVPDDDSLIMSIG
jgi:hypothetical protein